VIERLGRFVTHRPRAVSLSVLAAVLPLAAFAGSAPLDNSVRVWLVEDEAKLAAYDRFLKTFGPGERVLAVVRDTTPRARPDAGLLVFVRDLVAALESRDRFPEVDETVSIVDVARDEVETLLDPRLGGMGELPRLRRRLLAAPINRSLRLLDLDRGRASVSVGLVIGPPRERRAFLAKLEPFRERARREGRELLLAGEPLVNVALDDGAAEIDTVFLPVLVSVSVAAVLLMMRSVRLAAITLLPVGLTVAGTSGLIALAGCRFNLLLVTVKPLLFVLALATAVHVAQSYQQGLREGLDRAGAAAFAFSLKAVPCLFSAATTMVGFGAFATATVRPIRETGVFAALGVGLSLFLSLGLQVALLALFGPATAREGARDRAGEIAERITRWITQRRHRAAAAVLLALVIGGAGGATLRSLPIDTNAVSYLPPSGRVRSEYEAIEQEGIGLFAAEVVLRARDGSSIGASTSALNAALEIERAARAREGVTATLSIAQVLVDGSWRASGSLDLPHASIVRDVLATPRLRLAARRLLGDGEGADARAIRVLVFAKTAGSGPLLALVRSIEEDIARLGGPLGLEGEVTGSFSFLLATQVALVRTLGQSLGEAGLLIGVAVLVLVRSPRRALLAAVPNALAVLGNFVLMKALAIPLDVGTVMTGSIVLGIAVDDAIHYLFHYGRARARGETPGASCGIAARIAGRSLLVATAITAAGFLTLLPSDFAPTWRFGLLGATGLALALIGTILVLPAELLLFDARPDRTTAS
jgi:predicted RND superfamily exporter protein